MDIRFDDLLDLGIQLLEEPRNRQTLPNHPIHRPHCIGEAIRFGPLAHPCLLRPVHANRSIEPR